MEKIQITKYKSFDGLLFDKEDDCLKHEETKQAELDKEHILAEKSLKITQGISAKELVSWQKKTSISSVHNYEFPFVGTRDKIDALTEKLNPKIEKSHNHRYRQSQGYSYFTLKKPEDIISENDKICGFIKISLSEAEGGVLGSYDENHASYIPSWVFLSIEDLKMLILSKQGNKETLIEFYQHMIS